MDHNRAILEAFSKQASSFGDKGLTLSSQEILGWIVQNLPLQENFQVLDAAAGTGHLSRAMAPYVKKVVAIDITPEMLEQARQETESMNLENIWIEEGNVEDLPYEENSFDMVVSRLAIHHFEKPILPLKEMVRVCKPDHNVGIIDLLSPEDEEVAVKYNQLEKLRDPSHTVALSRTQMEKILEESGLTIRTVSTQDVQVDFERWIQMTGTDLEMTAYLRDELLNDIPDGTKTGMRPFLDDDALKFLQVWSILIGEKISDNRHK